MRDNTVLVAEVVNLYAVELVDGHPDGALQVIEEVVWSAEPVLDNVILDGPELTVGLCEEVPRAAGRVCRRI